MKLFVVVLRRPWAGFRLKGHWLVHQQARRGQLAGLPRTSRFQRREIDEGFEKRPWLPPRLDGSVELTPPVIPPSHQRQDRPGLRIEHHHGPLYRLRRALEMRMRSL